MQPYAGLRWWPRALMAVAAVVNAAVASWLFERRDVGSGILADRSRWLAGHVLVTALGTILVLAAGGAGVALGYLATTGDADDAWRYGLPVLQQVPAVLVLAAVARLLYGVRPGWAGAAWGYLGFAVVVLLFAQPLRVPEVVQDLSPFSHLALAPAEDVAWGTVLGVALAASLVSVAGQMAFRRRDIG